MEVFPQDIDGVFVLKPERLRDTRGYLCEQYNRRDFESRGLAYDFVQDNMSLSAAKGTVRGLHFQAPPSSQAKLLGVLRGAILDVVVDIRKASPSYGRHVAVDLSAENGLLLLAPRGFAHGFCTLVPETLVHYKVDFYHDASREFGLRWNDPALKIAWPVGEDEAILSARDRLQPLLAELPEYFSSGAQ